jgi:hypothetical protein
MIGIFLLTAMLLTSGAVIIQSKGVMAEGGATITVPDDYPTINEALAHVSDGDVIQVRAGTYVDSVNIFYNITITALDGPSVTFLEPYNGMSFQSVVFHSTARLQGFTLRASYNSMTVNGAAAGSNISDCVFLNTSSNIYASNVEFWNNTVRSNVTDSYLIYWEGDQASIRMNHFEGVQLTSRGDDSIITDNTFNNLKTYIEGDNTTCSSNRFEDYATESMALNGHNCTISKNEFRDIGLRAITVQAGPNRIVNNSFTRIGETAVTILSTSYSGEGCEVGWNSFDTCDCTARIGIQRYTRFHNNTVLNGNPSSTNEGNIRVGDLTTIENCTLLNCKGNGVVIAGNDVLMKDNNISSSILTLHNAITALGTGADIIRNKVFDNDGTGVMCYGNDNIVSRNIISFNDGYGIQVYASGCQITWNDLIYNNQTARSWEGNLWDHNLYSDYNGPDDDQDGIGDLPYTVPSWGVQDLHPRYLQASDLGAINLGLVPFSYDEAPGDGAVYYDADYYLDIGEKLSKYYYEVSYGQLLVSVQVLYGEDGMYHLPQSMADLWNMTSDRTTMSRLISMVDDDHDLQGYDYNASGGKGCLAFVAPLDLNGENTSLIRASSTPYGGYQTNDSTSVDFIYTFNSRFNGDDKTIRALAHEYGHFLGKALVTSVSGHAKGDEWILPDQYLMGDLTCRESLMGKLTSVSLERVHLDSYSKEWLGWLGYENVTTDSQVIVPVLPKLGHGGKVYRLTYDMETLPGFDEQGFMLFEYRSNDPGVSEWDVHTDHAKAIHIYHVQILGGGSEKIDLLEILLQVGTTYILPWADVKVEVEELAEGHAILNLTAFDAKDLVGAVVAGNGTMQGSVGARTNHDNSGLVGFPDTDLHARDRFGRHVGVNRTSGLFDAQIPGALFSGDARNGLEWIYAPSDLQPEFWVEAGDTEAFVMENPQYAYLDDVELFGIMVQYFDEDGVAHDTEMRSRNVTAGQEYAAEYSITTVGNSTIVVLEDMWHNITFRQTGLPPGTMWSVTLDGESYHSNGSEMVITSYSGEHQFQIGEVAGYDVVPNAGTLLLGDLDMSITVLFSAERSEQTNNNLEILLVLAAVLVAVGTIAVLAIRRGIKQR